MPIYTHLYPSNLGVLGYRTSTQEEAIQHNDALDLVVFSESMSKEVRSTMFTIAGKYQIEIPSNFSLNVDEKKW